MKMPQGESSQVIRERVIKARETQADRFKGSNIFCNAKMSSRQIRQCCVLDSEAQGLLKEAIVHLNLSARAYDKILKVSRTIADLENSEIILASHVAEATQYRFLDRG